MAEKKNQPYLPKAYLRNFSYQNNGKQIGVFIPKNRFYFPTAKLKSQGSKNFYYGKDSSIEDSLMSLEDRISPIIRDILENKKLPLRESDDHLKLLCFVALTELRNPININKSNEMMGEINRRLIEISPNITENDLIPELTHQASVELSLSGLSLNMTILRDLDYKILINNTNRCFISSDFPIIKYNQFLESKRWPLIKTGNGVIGLQILIPLNSQQMLILFDSSIYKIGNKKQQNVLLNNPDEIDQLNILQFLNNIESIYFDDKCDQNYLNKLHLKSIKYKRAHTAQADLVPLKEIETNLNKDSDLIYVGSSDLDINLSISEIKIHTKGKKIVLTDSAAQLRKWPNQILKSNNIH